MPATLDLIAGKLDHVILVAELTADRVQRVEDAQLRTEETVSKMRSIALRLSAASLALSASRALSAIASPTRSLAALAVGAFGGGFVATLLWQLLHAKTALAGLLP